MRLGSTTTATWSKGSPESPAAPRDHRPGRRALDDDRTDRVGPLTTIDRTAQAVRFTLVENEVQPISFDLTVTGVLPRSWSQGRRTRNTSACGCSRPVRYHQPSTVAGGSASTAAVEVPTMSGWLPGSPGASAWTRRQPHRTCTPAADGSTSSSPGAPCGCSADGTTYELHHYLQWVNGEVVYFPGRQPPTDADPAARMRETCNRRGQPSAARRTSLRLAGGNPHGGVGHLRHRFPSRHRPVLRYKGHGTANGAAQAPRRRALRRHLDTRGRSGAHQLRARDPRPEGDRSATVFESIIIGAHSRYGLTGRRRFSRSSEVAASQI